MMESWKLLEGGSVAKAAAGSVRVAGGVSVAGSASTAVQLCATTVATCTIVVDH